MIERHGSVKSGLTAWLGLGVVFLLCIVSAYGVRAVEREGDYEQIQKRLLSAEPGDLIELPEGHFELERSLSVMTDGIRVVGEGPGKTILSFVGQRSGAEGLLVEADDVHLEGFAIRDTQGDGLRVHASKGVVVKNLRVEWTQGARPSNGAYGVYPIRSENVVVDSVYVQGASEAGIYIGQSEKGRISNCTVTGNVAGIELENTRNIVVSDNEITGNSVGLLVSEIPDILKGGGPILIESNTINDNNLENFSANELALTAHYQGVGVMVVAAKQIKIADNNISNHKISNVALLNLASTHAPAAHRDYNPTPEDISILENQMEQPGHHSGDRAVLANIALDAYQYDVVWDGNTSRRDIESALSGCPPISIKQLDALRVLNLMRSQNSRSVNAGFGGASCVK